MARVKNSRQSVGENEDDIKIEESSSSQEEENTVISNMQDFFKSYTTKKSLSSILMDGALLAYNAAQLRVLFVEKTERDALWIISLSLTLISIVAQVVMGVILAILARSNSDVNEEGHKRYIDYLNDIVLALTALVSALNIMLNVFIQVDFSDFLKKST